MTPKVSLAPTSAIGILSRLVCPSVTLLDSRDSRECSTLIFDSQDVADTAINIEDFIEMVVNEFIND